MAVRDAVTTIYYFSSPSDKSFSSFVFFSESLYAFDLRCFEFVDSLADRSGDSCCCCIVSIKSLFCGDSCCPLVFYNCTLLHFLLNDFFLDSLTNDGDLCCPHPAKYFSKSSHCDSLFCPIDGVACELRIHDALSRVVLYPLPRCSVSILNYFLY